MFILSLGSQKWHHCWYSSPLHGELAVSISAHEWNGFCWVSLERKKLIHFLSFKTILVICSLEWNISEQTIFLPLINRCWIFIAYISPFKKMTFEIKKNQGTVCPWNKLLQVCSSDNQSKKDRPLTVKSPPGKDRQSLTSFSGWLSLHSVVPTYLIPSSAHKSSLYKE